MNLYRLLQDQKGTCKMEVSINDIVDNNYSGSW